MSVDFNDLLDTDIEDVVDHKFPAGTYLVQISDVDLLPFYWKANEKRGPVYGRCIVPTLTVIDYIPDPDPDLQAATEKALADFGDWKGFRPPYNRGRYTYDVEIPGYEEKVTVAGISPVNFQAVETESDFATKIKESNALSKFYNHVGNDGEPSGFAMDIVSMSPDSHRQIKPEGRKIGDVVKAISGGYFLATYDYTSQVGRDGTQYEPRLEIVAVAPVE